jgi:FkbM family methyltransferase
MTEVRVGRARVRLMGDGDRIVDHIAQKGSFEPQSLEVWARMVKKGRVALDVGAYTGLFSIAAAHLGASRVVAIEPIQRLVERLQRNAQRNAVSIDVQRMAASDRTGSAMIGHNIHLPFSAGASLERKTGPHEKVRLIRIDDLDLRNLACIKVDVERHEAAAMRGARKTLERERPMLLIEALDDDRAGDVMRELPGYRLIKRLDFRNLWLEPV